MANNDTICKIGQYPSIADLEEYKVSKYRKILGDDNYRELTKAIGLKSHGIGVGSFVYLRRIFETLIENAHSIAQKDSQWSEEDYLKSRMSEKIQLLKHELPSFLVENKHIYGIISKGIHELQEPECLGYFEIIKNSIEIMLDDMLAAKNKAEKEASLREDLTTISSKLSEN